MRVDRPICLAVLPFEVHGDTSGRSGEHLQRIYECSVVPAAQACGFLVSRLDPSMLEDVGERRVLDQVLLSDVAVFDLTHAKAETAYLLGMRLAFRPGTSLILRRQESPTPLKVRFSGVLSYALGHRGQFDDAHAAALREKIAEVLAPILEGTSSGVGPDLAMYDLVTEYRSKQISRAKTDEFRQLVSYSENLKRQLARARALEGPSAIEDLRRVETGLGSFEATDSAVLIDLFLSYRAVSAWSEMVRLYGELPNSVRRSTMLREQLAMAMNRLGQRLEALSVLEDVESMQGPSSESSALIGRVYKDLWKDALQAGDDEATRKHLRNAIAAYRRGFETDWRDAYPGINAATLLNVEGSEESLRELRRLLPVVRFAAEQRLAYQEPDYWDFATLMELAVIDDDREASEVYLTKALRVVREAWERETTLGNLQLLRRLRVERREEVAWVDGLISLLTEPPGAKE